MDGFFAAPQFGDTLPGYLPLLSYLHKTEHDDDTAGLKIVQSSGAVTVYPPSSVRQPCVAACGAVRFHCIILLYLKMNDDCNVVDEAVHDSRLDIPKLRTSDSCCLGRGNRFWMSNGTAAAAQWQQQRSGRIPKKGGRDDYNYSYLSCGGVTFSRSVPDKPDSPDGAGEGRSHPASCPPTPVVIPPYLPTRTLRRLVVVIAGSFVRFRRDYQWMPYSRYLQRDRPD